MRKIDVETLKIMENEERHNCNNCIHEVVCEWAVYSEDILCNDFIDKKSIEDKPKGKWIQKQVKADAFTTETCYVCSNCGHRKAFEWGFIVENFCWNCGTRIINNNDT